MKYLLYFIYWLVVAVSAWGLIDTHDMLYLIPMFTGAVCIGITKALSQEDSDER